MNCKRPFLEKTSCVCQYYIVRKINRSMFVHLLSATLNHRKCTTHLALSAVAPFSSVTYGALYFFEVLLGLG